MVEQWKDVTGYEGLYQVSDLGNVKSLNYMHTGVEGLLAPHTNMYGYRIVCLYKDGHQHSSRVHRLVLAAFVGISVLECNHKDTNKANNRLDNLEYVTSRQNINHAIAAGLFPKRNLESTWVKGEDHHNAKVTDAEVQEIRDLYATGEYNQTEIGERFGIHRTTVSRFVRYKKRIPACPAT